MEPLKPIRKPETVRWGQEIQLEAMNRRHFNLADSENLLRQLALELNLQADRLARRAQEEHDKRISQSSEAALSNTPA
jgi:hypothetical protein